MTDIETIHNPCEDDLVHYTSRGRPVRIANAFDHWSAMTNWDAAYLKGPVTAPPHDVPYFTASKAGDVLRQNDKFIDFPELIENVWQAPMSAAPEQQNIVYMRQVSLKDFPHLVKDVETPAFYKRPLVDTNLWIGQAGSVSALHFDFLDNLLCQVQGHKKITLYAPDQTKDLHPAFAHAEPSEFIVPPLNFSLIDFNAERFPDLATRATAVAEINIAPGDMLYIPPYWWHRVETTTGPSVSVNFWYAAQYGKPYTSVENAQEIAFLGSLNKLTSVPSTHKRHAWQSFLRAMRTTGL